LFRHLKTDFDSKEKAEKSELYFIPDKLNHLKTIIIDNSFILKNEYSDRRTLVWAESKLLKENIHCERDLRQARHILLLNYLKK